MNRNCFPSNYIGLIGDCVTYTTTGSGLNINDLPGLSFRLLSSLSTEEQKTASGLFQVAHAEGLKRFIRDFKAGMASDYLYKSVLSSQTEGRLAETFGALGSNFVGKEVELVDCRDRFQCLYIEYIDVVLDADTDLNISIIDGCDTTTTLHSLTCGKNRIQLNYEASSTKVQIVYDGTKTNMPDEFLCWNSGCDQSCSGCHESSYSGFKTSNVEASILTDPFLVSNIENGLVIAASVRCSSMELVCIFFDEAAESVRYAIGIDILKRVIGSDRMNPLVRMKQDQISEIMIEWNGGKSGLTGFSHKGEYKKSMELLIEQGKNYLASLTGSTRCMKCNGTRILGITP